MTLDELIAKLQEMRAHLGNVEVYHESDEGAYYRVQEVRVERAVGTWVSYPTSQLEGRDIVLLG